VAARSKARKRALDVLFEAELRGLPVLGLLAERMSLGEQPTPEYAAEIVRGVAAHRDEIDDLISRNAVDWTLERMPIVDLTVLRMGVWELLWADDVPDGVAISEAVVLAQDLSTDGSPAFVNGLLAKVKNLKPGIAAAKAEAAKAEAARNEAAKAEAEAARQAEAARDEAAKAEAVSLDDEAAREAQAGGLDDEEASRAGEAVGGRSSAEAKGGAATSDEAVMRDDSPAEASTETEASPETAGPAQPVPGARRATSARTPRSGRGLLKPPRVAVKPESDSTGS
jgi:N utilization substance protein B